MEKNICKNHKRNIENNKRVRLINLSKTEFWLISICIIQNIMTKILDDLKYVVWRDSRDTIKWFKTSKFKDLEIVNF